MTARPHKLGFIFVAALVTAVFVAKGAIYRPDLWKVY